MENKKQTHKADSEKKVVKDASHYFMSSNVPGKEQDGISHHILALWCNIENWFGDIKKAETGRQFLLRIQSLYDIKLKGSDTGCLVANAFMQSLSFTTTTPLYKVDNHIGETEISNKAVKHAEKNLPINATSGFYYVGEHRGYIKGFVDGATYRTQHPDPALVDRDYRDTLNEMLIEGYKKQLAQDKEVMVDRILEYVADENDKILDLDVFGCLSRGGILAMKHPILNKLNDGK